MWLLHRRKGPKLPVSWCEIGHIVILAGVLLAYALYVLKG